MISEHAIYGGSAVVYALATVAFLVFSRRQPPHLRRYCHLLVSVVGVAAVTAAAWALGLGAVPVGSGQVVVPQLIDGLFAYPLLFGFAAFVAGSSRRTVALVAGISAAQRVSYEVGALTDGLLGLSMLVVVVGGFVAHVYLLFGPVWRTAQRQPVQRRLLYWKVRNLLLFLIGVLIAAAMLSLSPLLDSFTAGITVQYVDVLLRVGFAGFLIGNIRALDADSGADAADSVDSTSTAGAAAVGDAE